MGHQDLGVDCVEIYKQLILFSVSIGKHMDSAKI